ncbi:uncharacterized protein E0L32_001046 [Thyridium curvatum]|uniref:SWIM-type domain-containing protein n=1 Tax=Thyridium curvatum TaxID=1093900 RepID=A0A507B2U3_9PEZI|nr:uncharacterized protein E0L32_001046 [Thyridium curvatum]TPX11228.1 hypothetical protein E0L32_001046 [Thyridium curvatum]
MVPATRTHGQKGSTDAGSPARHDLERDPLPHEEDEESDDDYSTSLHVRSPTTGLRYNIENLGDETQDIVRDLFSETPQEDLPLITLQWCNFDSQRSLYAFQVHEIVPRAIYVGASDSSYPSPSCNCMKNGSGPCRHLIWLMDQLAKQTVHDHDPEQELELNDRGFPSKVGDPYARIADFHLDILADGLHCDPGFPNTFPEPNRHRVREAREILAAVADIDDDEQDNYRPEIFDAESPTKLDQGEIITRGDLELTLLHLLLSNNEIFAMFLKLLDPTDKVRDPFRKLQQRVARVLDDLNAYTTSQPTTRDIPSSTATEQQDSSAAGSASTAEGPRDVPWAARHIARVVQQIHIMLDQSRPLSTRERASAARALVWILKAVASADPRAGGAHPDRNLYQRLIGGGSSGSGAGADSSDTATMLLLLDALLLLPDQSQYIDELESIRDVVGVGGYQESFMRRLEGLVTVLRKGVARKGRERERERAAEASAAAAAAAAAAASAASASASSSRAGSKRAGGPSGSESGQDRGAKRAR